MKTALYIIIFLIIADVLGACAWMYSGQPIPDGWCYLGSGTVHLIRSLDK